MCGRDNPEQLTFCSECGHRLGGVGAVPTPAATAPAPTAPTATGKARPPAPPVSFSKRRDAEPADVAAFHDPAPSARPSINCALCGTTNQRGLRFCITCGQLLANLEESGADHVGDVDLLRTSVDAVVGDTAVAGDTAPIAPARVIDVTPPTPRMETRVCPRCRGACDAGTQFCRFCGLSLGAPTTSGAAVALPPPVTSRGVSPPAPVSLANARLVLITRDGSEGPNYTLGESNDLGRLEGQILFPDDPYISPRHARIVARGAELFLRDLESTNGVFMRIPYRTSVGDKEIVDREDKITIRGHRDGFAREPSAEQELADQELFLVGQQVLRFDVVKEAEEAFGPASENGTLLFGSPAAPRYARLGLRTVEGVVRDVFHVRRAETIIGRESGDIVFTDDPFLSRRHCVLRMHAVAGGHRRRFTLADLGSSNGTFLRIRDEIRLRHGDHFRIGQQLLRFDIDAAHAGV
jgi:pSer/pThr/pTyr-binding forkhead associated (FHA) protein